MRSSDDIVERIRSATSIVDIVSEHVRLRKRGKNYLGLCPFHTEKTPSFNVLDDKGIYKCFGCGESGDVFSFVMKIEGLNFPETLEKLAKVAGIDYVKSEKRSDEVEDKTEPLVGACREFAGFCYRSLRAEQGMGAMEYLRDREFSQDILKKFGVGYAPEGDHSFLRSQSISSKTLGIYEQAGIISKNDRGEQYERFRNRIIFPIMNQTGRIIAFGGRVMPGASKEIAKYVNSPETMIYHKSQILYGLFQAKEAIRKKDFAILVEGYADVLAVSQAGFENVIAAAGTSLTTEQLNLLRRYTKTIVLLFDADLAGKNAALRGIELALTADFDVSCIVLPQGEDPDSFLKKEGADGFERQLGIKTSFIETKARLLKEQGLFDTPEGSARAIRSLVESIAKVPDAIKRELFIRRIAEKFKLMETTLLAELQKITGRERREVVRKQIETGNRNLSHLPIDTSPPQQVTEQKAQPAEKELLRAFLENTAVAYKALIEVDFDFTLLQNEFVKSIIMMAIKSYEETGESPSAAILLEAFHDDEVVRKMIIDTLVVNDKISEEWEAGNYTITEIEERIGQSAKQSSTVISKAVYKKEQSAMYPQLNRLTDEDELNEMLEKAMIAAQMIHPKN
ncbi:MAG: DNA primase [bacterium]